MFGPGRLGGDDPDDDDDYDDSPEEPTNREKIAVAVAIAGLSAAVVKLVEWGVEKIREKFDPPTKEESTDEVDS